MARERPTASFATLTEAKRFQRHALVAVETGTHTDPRKGKATFETYAREWLTRKAHKPSTATAISWK